MNDWQLDQLLERVDSQQVFWGLLTGGVFALILMLLVLMWTRWGQSQPLRKCLFLSALTHLLLVVYASSLQWAAATTAPPGEDEPSVQISSIEFLPPDLPAETADASPADQASDAADAALAAAAADAEPIETERERPELSEPGPLEREAAGPLPEVPDQLPVPEYPDAEPTLADADAQAWEVADDQRPEQAAEPVAAPESPTATRREAAAPPPPPAPVPRDRLAADEPAPPIPQPIPPDAQPAPALELASPLPQMSDAVITPEPAPELLGPNDSSAGLPPPASPLAEAALLDALRPLAPTAAAGTALVPPGEAPRPQAGELPAERVPEVAGGLPGLPALPTALSLEPSEVPLPGAAAGVPLPYQERVMPDRARLVRERGGSSETEAAVDAALAWLAANQSGDGRWDAQRFGAGAGAGTDGQNRGRAGLRADTGMTGLALLAFLGAGHTHLAGPYQDTLRRGLEFLLSQQSNDGSLSGQADSFAAMYCHGMAGIALSEAFAMTRDRRLERPVRRAVGYTLSAQHPSTGGWRYKRGDLGDTSQLGWQLMLLKSAQLGGVELPPAAREGAIRYLRSVSSGRHQGLASYRPRERATRSMTAEALFCRQLLGLTRENPAGDEAGDFVLEELPSAGQRNLYYWYYATLSLFQLQGTHWQTWNQALQEALVSTQHREGELTGSWDPQDTWGGYGGRVYSTALGALCLEVYYRYLPLYDVAGRRSGWLR